MIKTTIIIVFENIVWQLHQNYCQNIGTPPRFCFRVTPNPVKGKVPKQASNFCRKGMEKQESYIGVRKKQEVRSSKYEKLSRKQEVRRRKNKLRSGKQEVGSKKLEVRNKKQDFRSRKLEIATFFIFNFIFQGNFTGLEEFYQAVGLHLERSTTEKATPSILIKT